MPLTILTKGWERHNGSYFSQPNCNQNLITLLLFVHNYGHFLTFSSPSTSKIILSKGFIYLYTLIFVVGIMAMPEYVVQLIVIPQSLKEKLNKRGKWQKLNEMCRKNGTEIWVSDSGSFPPAIELSKAKTPGTGFAPAKTTITS